ncbi:Os11g0545000, partial [Oryza sativa Japonica Group]
SSLLTQFCSTSVSFTGAVDFVKNHGLYLLLLETPSGFSIFSLCGVYIHLPDAIQVGVLLSSFFPFWLNNIIYVLAYSCRCVPLYYPEYLGDVRYLQVFT